MSWKFQNLKEFEFAVKNNATFRQALQSDPENTLKEVEFPLPDTRIYRMVVGFIGAIVVLVVVSYVWLTLEKLPMPEGLISIGSVALGALCGLLVPTPNAQ